MTNINRHYGYSMFVQEVLWKSYWDNFTARSFTESFKMNPDRLRKYVSNENSSLPR